LRLTISFTLLTKLKYPIVKILPFILCASFFVLKAQNQPIPYGNNPKAGNYFTHQGVKIYYEIYGEGKPLVILHGSGGSIKSRTALLPEFSSKYKVIAFDNRCHGKSDCPQGYLTYEQIAADVNAVLENLNIDSAFVWGHSDGGIVGLLLSIHYPKKVKKCLASGANLRPDTTAVDPGIPPLLDKMWPMMKNDSARAKQFRLLAEQPNIKASDLKKIKADVLIMGGDRDVIRNEHFLEMYNNIPNAFLCILPATTHGVYSDRSKWFMEILHDFFNNPQRRKTTVELMMSQFK
jgi:pimeloyl-ACP methyl ester carboxylesterase